MKFQTVYEIYMKYFRESAYMKYRYGERVTQSFHNTRDTDVP